MQNIFGSIDIINDFLWGKVLIVLLLSLGVFFSFKFRFMQIRQLGHMIKLLLSPDVEKSENRGVSSFQAFCISLASRVGTGNIAGVAIAISTGGPGAVFWMWVVALLGAATGLVESTLAQVYKVKDEYGYRGGPAYYMEKGLGARWMGVIFSVLITLTFAFVFNSVQANTITLAFAQAFDFDKIIVGIIITVISAGVIFGGIKRIASISEKIVPWMAIVYIVVVLYVMVLHYKMIPAMFSMIIKEAFNLKSAFGGSLGVVITLGVKRGLFSNEAGMGSAPNAAATASVSHPVQQGFVQALGVFTDTLIICSATAFIILLSGEYGSETAKGIQLTQLALSTLVGQWAQVFIAICIFLFAFSSIIGNYYYGETNIEFLGAGKKTLTLFRIGVIGMIFVGAIVELDVVWALADLFMGSMAILNLIAITLLSSIAYKVFMDYENQLKRGKTPTFNPRHIDGLEHADCWTNKRRNDLR